MEYSRNYLKTIAALESLVGYYELCFFFVFLIIENTCFEPAVGDYPAIIQSGISSHRNNVQPIFPSYLALKIIFQQTFFSLKSFFFEWIAMGRWP